MLRKPEIILVIGPREFFAIKPTIEAMTNLEGKSTLSAAASVLSKMSLALVMAFLIAKKTIIKATAIMMKIMDQMTTKIIRAISRTDIVLSIQYKVKFIDYS